MRVASKTRWWMVERGGRYLLMSVLGDPKQLLEEPSSCPRQWEHVLSAPHPSTKEMIPSLVFSWPTSYLGKGFTAGGRAWGHFAGGSQLVEQWILSQHSCCVRTPQEVTNLAFSMVAWLSLHLKTNQQSSPFWPVLPRHFSLPEWFSWARWAVQAGKQLWCSGLGPPNTRRHNIWIIPRDSPGTRGSPPMLLSNSQLQTYSLPLREKKRRGGRKERSWFKVFLWVIEYSTELCPYWALSGAVMSTWRCHCWPPLWGMYFWEDEFLTFAFREEKKPCSFFVPCTGSPFI